MKYYGNYYPINNQLHLNKAKEQFN